MSVSIKDNKETSIINIVIEKKDYENKVSSILNDYRKRANIPGFRKGFVPMGMIKKQYEIPVKVDEINKVVQKKLSEFIDENKISLLGTPIPIENEKIDWKSDVLNLDFEIAKTPEFKINYKFKKAVPYYKITADKKMIDNQVDSIRKQYGKIISLKKPEKESTIVCTISFESIEYSKDLNLPADKLKSKFLKEIEKIKIGSQIEIKINDLFKLKEDFMTFTGLQKEKIENLSSVTFKLSEINKTEKADLKEDLFKKVYADNTPKNSTEFKKRIKNEIESQFVNQSDQKFLNDVTDEFIKVSKIKFPEEFVKKLIKANSKEELSDEEVQNEFDNSINGLKYQLIEAKLLEENNIIINHEMLKEFAEKSIRNQMMAYGQLEPSKKDIDSITARIFSNEEEVKRMTHQLISEKLLVLYKEKVNKKITETSYEKYIELAYKKND